jgi:hypothetical protein
MEKRMSVLKYLGCAFVLGLGLAPGLARAEGYRLRQYYGGWQQTVHYSYRPYYYKPTPEYSGYKHNYVVYYHDRPEYYYFYSPYTRQFWGRCPVSTGGKPLYSFLQEEDRPAPAEIAAAPPKAPFPPEAAPPTIPQTPPEKKADPAAPALDLPPDDLPPKPAGPPAKPVAPPN